MSIYSPDFLLSGLTKDQIRQKYVELYENVLRKLEDSNHIFQGLNQQAELLSLYRKLYGENSNDTKLREIESLQYEIEEMRKDLELTKSAICGFIAIITNKSS
jgi:hypothetical protein